MQSNQRSRLSRNAEKQSKKQLVIFLVGIVIVMILIVKFGIDAITGFGSVTSKLNKDNSASNSSTISLDHIDSPVLTQFPTAVKQNTTDISGSTAQPGGTVELYINNAKFDEVSVSGSSFTFHSVKLSSGDNDIKVRQRLSGKTSDFSRDYHITYANQPPKLDISFPTDGEVFGQGDQDIDVTGKTDPQNKVTINSFVAIVDDSGNFKYHMTLNNGDNALNVEAINPAGIKTDKTIHVTFNQ